MDTLQYNIVNKKKPLFLNIDINPECKNLIEKLLIVDSNNRLDWEELYENNWIYNNNNIQTNIGLSDSDKLKKEINILVKKEDSFDYCFENSVSDLASFENNTVFDDELNHETINNKQNVSIDVNLKLQGFLYILQRKRNLKQFGNLQ